MVVDGFAVIRPSVEVDANLALKNSTTIFELTLTEVFHSLPLTRNEQVFALLVVRGGLKSTAC